MTFITLLPPLRLLATGKAALQRPRSEPHVELKYSLNTAYSIY